jgi:hypothetical protein
MFVCKDLKVNKLDISRNCIEKDLENCAVELETEECCRKLEVSAVIMTNPNPRL